MIVSGRIVGKSAVELEKFIDKLRKIEGTFEPNEARRSIIANYVVMLNNKARNTATHTTRKMFKQLRRTNRYHPNGAREVLRRRVQIELGMLKAENGLVV